MPVWWPVCLGWERRSQNSPRSCGVVEEEHPPLEPRTPSLGLRHPGPPCTFLRAVRGPGAALLSYVQAQGLCGEEEVGEVTLTQARVTSKQTQALIGLGCPL